jgi:2-polyprenyl-3-methyl-5-hydroxy-6-metoxy-1,4-benzoquinol methylase
MPDRSAVGQQWSELYDSGRDYWLIPSAAVSRFLAFTDGMAPTTCLDIGCGTGHLTRELYHRGYQCTGIDASASAVRIASSLTTVPRDHLRYVQLDVEQDDLGALPQPSYPLITCKLVYAFIQDKPAFLRNVARLLNPNGVFVVITPLPEDVPPEKRHIAVNEQELELLASGFSEAASYREGALTYFAGTKRIS